MSFPRYSKYKASGVEWLGEVPEHWEITTGRRLFAQKRDPSQVDDEQLSVTQKYGVIPQSKFMEIEDQKVTLALSGLDNFKHVNTNDFVISLRSFQGGIEHSAYEGCVSPAYTILSPCRLIYPPFWKYLLKSKGYIESLQAVTDGIRDGKNISYEQFGKIFVPKTQIAEQTAIAAFLDRETAKIDALIAEQRRLIELLKEKRQAVISHAVTKGLNPNAKMKPSGVEWLGDIPEHWEVMRLGYLGRVQNGLNIGGELFGSGDPFVSYGDVYKNATLPEVPSGLVRSTQEDQSKCSLVVGDVLFTRTSETADDIGVASTCLHSIPRATFAGFLIRFRPKTGTLEPQYSKYLFRNQGVHEHFAGTLNLVTRASLSQDDLRMLTICIPSLCEQTAIATFLDRETARFDTLTAEAQRAIDLLQERRTALISAAVTGQIDVRQIATEETA